MTAKLNGEEVCQILKEKIASLEFKPGQPLAEQEMASLLKVSRTPIRYALSKLEGDGLVEIIPRKGAFVKLLSVKDILEIYQVRRALEGLAVRFAAKNADLEGLKELESYFLNSLEQDSIENLRDYFDLGRNLHSFIVQSAGNERVKKILNDLFYQLRLSLFFVIIQEPYIQTSRPHRIREHLAIIEALKKRDEDLAELRMNEHLTKAEKRLLSFQGINV